MLENYHKIGIIKIKDNKLKLTGKKLDGNFRISKLNVLNYKNIQIQRLFISNNILNSIDELPDELVELNCSSNKIVNLNNLPNTLKILSCNNNLLQQLNYLPESLEYLDCSSNKLTNIDNLPTGLINLICSYNNINNIDNLPYNLISLSCSHNNIKHIHKLPKSLKKLNCSFNNISHINFPENLLNITIDQKNIETILINNIACLINLQIYENNYYLDFLSRDTKLFAFKLNKNKLLNNNPNLLIQYHY
jgi:Leucine-rich repeat (LRR) protein